MGMMTTANTTCFFLLLSMAHVLALIASAAAPRHPCQRPCLPGDSRTCEYDFHVEWYESMSKACYDCPNNITDCHRQHCVPLDGVGRPVVVVNRQLPGPGIQVCVGDELVVTVMNHLEDNQGVSVHWHGIHQRDTPHMDGVGGVTQCDIPRRASFRYKFHADLPGTQFYHGHSGFQRSDGLFGNLIIRSPDDPQRHLYDEDLPEHVMIITDWMVAVTLARFTAHHHSDGDNKPKSMLVNGKGRYKKFESSEGQPDVYTPVEVFHVKKGLRYRFRVAQAGILNCPIQMSVDSHNLTVIASDGQPFEPIVVDSLVIYAGERFDFVINTDEKVDNYWMKFMGLADGGERFTKAHQVAILRYEGATDSDPSGPTTYEDMAREGKQLNPLNTKASEELVPIAKLRSLLDNDETSEEKVDKQFYLATDFNKIDNKRFHHPEFYPIVSVKKSDGHLYVPQVNDIAMEMGASPILTQAEDLPEGAICDEESLRAAGRNCSAEFCSCVHVLKVSLGDLVEVIIVDEGVTFDASHPFHLHGNTFRVVAQQKINKSTSVAEVKQLDQEGKIVRKLDRAVVKDTVIVPDGGYTIVRFVADNPGFWLFHCHLDWHMEIGMGVVFQVGERHQMPEPPPGFPKCGDWHGGASGAPQPSGASTAVVSPPTALVMAFLQLLLVLNKVLDVVMPVLSIR